MADCDATNPHLWTVKQKFCSEKMKGTIINEYCERCHITRLRKE